MNGFTSTIADALKYHNRQKFSTFDSDNDIDSAVNCASVPSRPWWFADCNASQFNEKYYSGGKMKIVARKQIHLIYYGIHWYSDGLNVFTDSVIFTEMKVRRKH